MRKEAGFENRDRFVELVLMISALRKAKGYTQHELAEKAHISRSHLSSIEAPNISSSFSLEVFFNIADILEVKPGDLLNLNLPSSYFNEDEKQKKFSYLDIQTVYTIILFEKSPKEFKCASALEQKMSEVLRMGCFGRHLYRYPELFFLSLSADGSSSFAGSDCVSGV